LQGDKGGSAGDGEKEMRIISEHSFANGNGGAGCISFPCEVDITTQDNESQFLNNEEKENLWARQKKLCVSGPLSRQAEISATQDKPMTLRLSSGTRKSFWISFRMHRKTFSVALRKNCGAYNPQSLLHGTKFFHARMALLERRDPIIGGLASVQTGRDEVKKIKCVLRNIHINFLSMVSRIAIVNSASKPGNGTIGGVPTPPARPQFKEAA
jgi:hypothetical protein